MTYYCPECKRMVPEGEELRCTLDAYNDRPDDFDPFCPYCETELQDPDFAEYQQPDPEIDDG